MCLSSNKTSPHILVSRSFAVPFASLNDTFFWVVSLQPVREAFFRVTPLSPSAGSGRHTPEALCSGGSFFRTAAYYSMGGKRHHRSIRLLADIGIPSAFRSDEQGCREHTRVDSPGSVSRIAGPCVHDTFSFSRRPQTVFQGGVTSLCSRQQRGSVLVAQHPGWCLLPACIRFTSPMGASGSSLYI